jgi:hypothetical protein
MVLECSPYSVCPRYPVGGFWRVTGGAQHSSEAEKTIHHKVQEILFLEWRFSAISFGDLIVVPINQAMAYS